MSDSNDRGPLHHLLRANRVGGALFSELERREFAAAYGDPDKGVLTGMRIASLDGVKIDEKVLTRRGRDWAIAQGIMEPGREDKLRAAQKSAGYDETGKFRG